MKERPILFSGEMVRSILDGRKTQTRRVMKPQPRPLTGGWMYDGRYFADDDAMWDYLLHNVYGEKGSPYGSLYADGTGDLLWVRETWQYCPFCGGTNYKAGANDNGRSCQHCDNDLGAIWKPSIHMRYEDSRITLRVTDVRVERVQEISHDDATAEGLTQWTHESSGTIHYGITHADVWEKDPRQTFQRLWDSINAARGHGWDVNPWVWVVSFERVTP